MAEKKMLDRLSHAWNAFTQNEEDKKRNYNYGSAYSIRPDRVRFNTINDKTMVSAIYNRIAIDSAAIDVFHVMQDDKNRFKNVITSALNECLTLDANIDQTGRSFMQDAVHTMLEVGVIAIVPVHTTGGNPMLSESYDIKELRVGKITQWMPQAVRVDVYDQRTGRHQEMTLPKKLVAIVENPLYAVMNEPNGTLNRLTRKLSMLDSVDEQSSNGKLDMIIQLPYVIKSEARREQAEQRRADIEGQLKGSKYGIAYTDGTEKITQLNRPVENNMLNQIKFLTEQLYGQLGLTEGVFNGTADDKQMTNYYNRTIEPIMSAVTDAMRRTFLSRTARTQHQTIKFYRDPFALMAITDVAELADKLLRNQVMTPNEFRDKLGLAPSDAPQADILSNPNMPFQDTGAEPVEGEEEVDAADQEEADAVDEELDAENQNADDQIDEITEQMLTEIQKLIDDLPNGGGDDSES